MTGYASNEFVALNFNDPRASEGTLQRTAEQIEAHTPYRVCDSWLSPQRRIGVLNLVVAPPEAKAPLLTRLTRDWLAVVPHTNRLRLRERMTVLQTGYTTTPERRFERSIRRAGEGLVCDDAGGIAAFCLVRFEDEDERLFLWSTRPGVRVIASALGPDGVVVGTRPRLVHALTRAFRAPDLDHGYLRASLNGWSLADRTPYEGTTLLSVDALLCIRDGQQSLKGHPTGAYAREERIFRKQKALYQDALSEAVEPLRSLRGFELQLSGGKDSRLVAAALAGRGIIPSTVICHGTETNPELPVARSVSSTFGWEVQCARPEFAYRGGLLETVRHNLSLSDGFLATEPRHLAFPVHSLVGDIGPGVVLGHIELQKGGWAQGMSTSREAVIERCRQRVTRFQGAVAPELTEENRRQVDAYVATLPALDAADYGYWINYRFRVCRWLTSHYLAYSKQRLPIYPLIDEKVTRVVSCAPLVHLVSERLLAETTWALAPALRSVPLVSEPYRFIQRAEQEAKQRTQPQAALASRPAVSAETPAPAAQPADTRPSHSLESVRLDPAPSSGPAPIPQPSAPPLLPKQNFVNEPLAREATSYIMAGALREELRSLMQPLTWAAFVEPTRERMEATRLGGQFFTEFLWTCYQASVLFTDGPDGW